MTRQEFLDDVTTFGDLLSFCWDNDCDICDDIYDQERMDDAIDERVAEMTRSDGWRNIYSFLDNVPYGDDYYRYDEYDDWVPLDESDFDDYQQEVLEWMDDQGYWDEEYDEDEEEADEECDQEEAPPEESLSVGDLMAGCQKVFASIVSVDSDAAEHRVPSMF